MKSSASPTDDFIVALICRVPTHENKKSVQTWDDSFLEKNVTLGFVVPSFCFGGYFFKCIQEQMEGFYLKIRIKKMEVLSVMKNRVLLVLRVSREASLFYFEI
ncbi:hypothetical protein CEXT_322931 [Caerostris extrusa]|uniref:Uncharacterized protein n=1 Tax=Caerostris extrusa TaxID=172846 RepID=A0AAV4NHB3_CAEEX|nr:hypothetical protein CEXT_322931 [Caerostris extrusa]